ncbi:hypothetical protein CRYUN_Cryun36dG0110900 [Craigia yunnanensis]
MKKLRWAMDGDFWELDASTPRTLEGAARAVPGKALPLGVSRGTRLFRPKQIDFMQRFMAAPFLPSYSNHLGVTLQRVFTIPFTDNWFVILLGQFNLHKFLSSFQGSGGAMPMHMLDLKSIGRLLLDKSLYALGFSSEILLTPDDTLLLTSDSYYAHNIPPRKKAFPHHNLTLDVAWPALFVDKETGNFWDVPFSMALDLASLSDSGPSYHLCLHHNNGSPKQFEDDHMAQVPASLLPGFSVKGAFSYKKKVDIWRSKAQKLKMVQPYDIFLSDPHVSASGIIGSTQLAQDLLNSHQPSSEAVKMICPTSTLSLQQQIAGPFSFRVDSGVVINFKNKGWHIQTDEPVFAIEYALQVLGSAKAVAWYSPKHQEFMVELRFFET